MSASRLCSVSLLVLASVSTAIAEPVTRPGGAACDSVEPGVTVKAKQDGKDVTCTADACHWVEFLDNPPRHVSHTSYSNVRDCHAAARINKGNLQIFKQPPLLKSP